MRSHGRELWTGTKSATPLRPPIWSRYRDRCDSVPMGRLRSQGGLSSGRKGRSSWFGRKTSPRLRLRTLRNRLISDSVAVSFWIADFGLIENQKSKIENPVTLLILDRISKSFGGVAAVKSVSLTVEAGENLGGMGPHGSGKTTFFNLINGALVADHVQV